TVEACIVRCEAAGYDYAGVEFGDECHCGTGYANGAMPQGAPASDCDVACAGNGSETCGGSWRIQVSTIDPSVVVVVLRSELLGCYVDTASSPALSNAIAPVSFTNNTDLVSQCVDYCDTLGYPYAGVEDAVDCQCGLSLSGGAESVDQSQCNSTCPLPGDAGREFCGGVQRMQLY
ncbi:hypothetical protein PUNSTDRAFT_20976, partial [Punctularia strigosozonata HHB-11173 SS5]